MLLGPVTAKSQGFLMGPQGRSVLYFFTLLVIWLLPACWIHGRVFLQAMVPVLT